MTFRPSAEEFGASTIGAPHRGQIWSLSILT
jgi:hypothetical protein